MATRLLQTQNGTLNFLSSTFNMMRLCIFITDLIGTHYVDTLLGDLLTTPITISLWLEHIGEHQLTDE